MSKMGGSATLSSLRVQKAFSINFRENKRLYAQLKLIETDRVRAIRQVKQEITETKLWLEGVQQTTGDSDKGIYSDIDSRSSSRIGRSTSRLSETENKLPATFETGGHAESATPQQLGHIQGQPDQTVNPGQHVRFSQSAVKTQRPRMPSIEIVPPSTAPSIARQSVKSMPTTISEQAADNEANGDEGEIKELYGESVEKPRLTSATSRNSQQSFTAYQRRKQLKNLIVKKRNLLDIKKEINYKECAKVNDKFADYILNMTEKLRISIPDLDRMNFEQHDTPFARNADVN